jgi:hypothetical protein
MIMLVVVAGAVLGGADQYAGSLYLPIATAVSLMSAPWLLLPFCFGCTQVRGRAGGVVGLAVTLAALAGYWAMTVSPVEGVPLSRFSRGFVTVAHSDARLLLAAVIAGPACGLLGQRWRTRRWWVGAVVAAGGLLLEPVTRVMNLENGPPLAYYLELAAGALAAAYFAAAVARSGRLGTPPA